MKNRGSKDRKIAGSQGVKLDETADAFVSFVAGKKAPRWTRKVFPLRQTQLAFYPARGATLLSLSEEL